LVSRAGAVFVLVDSELNGGKRGRDQERRKSTLRIGMGNPRFARNPYPALALLSLQKRRRMD
jgi:hypothetical protein